MENFWKLLSCYSRFCKAKFQLQAKYNILLALRLQYNNLLVFLKLQLSHQNYPRLKVDQLLEVFSLQYLIQFQIHLDLKLKNLCRLTVFNFMAF